ncbi:myb-like protein AA [Drosophila hydei]|uniref:Myb-like protein AA n=1 Tax=Drosophila hydei TaxID=7224 RepID=A0A6J2SP18_DROHY|nr:myb-like protein AA [Drosophila hydei]
MMMMMSPALASASASASASTDCSSSSMQGSTTSSASSDVMTLTTTAASSWCAMPASTRLRVVRLVRPHQRRLLMVPERSATFGFAVRGGKEHGIGFFVSHVEHGGEAQLKGLRIGDQILRINGYRLEDAVHKEFIQLVASQDRVTLKVRGVGMLPVKDQPDERLSWSVVKLPSVSGTPSESSFKATTERRTASRDINVVLHVAPRTKLGLGICKGPEWKPGIFVQFTKERSVAREAGLRPGDQILSVNSIDFSDVLFSEAVAVMKGSSKLDMVVRTAAGCDLFPGESSGYNSSASSVTGDQSPCWADAKSKRLTAVREEPTPAGGAAVQVHKQLNKTIIKLTENGTSINSTFVANACGAQQQQREHEQTLEQLSVSRSTTMRRSCSVAAPAPPPPAAAGAAAALSSSSAGSSLSSAITEELKKRKEKQQQQQLVVGQRSSQLSRDRDRLRDRDQRAEDRPHNGAGSSRSIAQVSHKRERNAASGAASGGAGGAGGAAAAATATGDQHTALMDEFKRAHQRMFRNGFHESEHKERGETLKRTSIMPDDSCYRNNNNNNSNSSNNNSNSSSNNIANNGSNRMLLLNGNSNNNNNNSNSSSNVNGSPELPPPPPQFANPQQKQQASPSPSQSIAQPPTQLKLSIPNGNGNGQQLTARSKQLSTASAAASPLSPVRSPSVQMRAPVMPQPDYDAATATPANGTQQRRTLRLGTVTIGEYSGEQRSKREMLRNTSAGSAQTNGILKNGNRSSNSFSNSNSSSGSNNNRQQHKLRQEQQRLQQQSVEEMRLLQQRLRMQRQQGVEQMRLLQQRHRQQRQTLQQRIDEEERNDRQRRIDHQHIMQLRTNRVQSSKDSADIKQPAQGLLMPPRFVVPELPLWYMPPKLSYEGIQANKEELLAENKRRLNALKDSFNLDRRENDIVFKLENDDFGANGISTEEVIAEIEDQMKEEIEMEDDINSDMLYIPTNFSLNE